MNVLLIIQIQILEKIYLYNQQQKGEMASEKTFWYINIFKFICYYRL